MGSKNSKQNTQNDKEKIKIINISQKEDFEFNDIYQSYPKQYTPLLTNKKSSKKKSLKHLTLKQLEKNPPRNLVFEGGGVKGLAYCGVLKQMEERGLLKYVRGYAGTSAGAIVAALCAVGYNVDELTNIIKETDFSDFLDKDLTGFFGEMYHLIKEFGEHSGNYFHHYISNFIKKKTGDPRYTFKNLLKDKGVNLVVVATDINKMKSIYFNPYNNGDTAIADAVRMSMSIPFLFYPVNFGKHLCVDGGLINNYPLHVFDGEFPGDITIGTVNMETVGFKLITPNEECNDDLYKPLGKIDNIKKFSYAIIESLIAANERRYIHGNYWSRTIPIHIKKPFSATRFKLSEKDKNLLIQYGTEALERLG